MVGLVEYQEGYAAVAVFVDDADGTPATLTFRSDLDDGGRIIRAEERLPVADFLAKGLGPWPWYDLGERRLGALRVVSALGADPPPWLTPLEPDALELFRRSERGGPSVADLLDRGDDPDPLDPCGGTPLWYAVRALRPEAAVLLVDAGADAGRVVDVTARGERTTTILHEMVRLGRTVALDAALARGVDPSPRDSDGATPMHCLDDRSDHVGPQLVRALAGAGAAVDAAAADGTRPIEVAARQLLPGTVAALAELGADPQPGLDALVAWWADAQRHHAYRAKEVSATIAVLHAAGAR
ncbi:ankyrin repeat domain-containing protein [Mycolicibacterium sediminis]|uniref:Ankyrin repeat protein n=1 Tax=Mycolicibacterium sediminis TaxID=1286180 RepID=A0A7I7QQA3_9MYCO|nr:ankyrin repeat domain-containing protein [Mycolicibacterium sediminis]BBY28511.1 hypothetical protein MSEDJ_26070 [Mycolicibacterium sediminis]